MNQNTKNYLKHNNSVTVSGLNMMHNLQPINMFGPFGYIYYPLYNNIPHPDRPTLYQEPVFAKTLNITEFVSPYKQENLGYINSKKYKLKKFFNNS